jgi:hypothetical protein
MHFSEDSVAEFRFGDKSPIAKISEDSVRAPNVESSESSLGNRKFGGIFG